MGTSLIAKKTFLLAAAWAKIAFIRNQNRRGFVQHQAHFEDRQGFDTVANPRITRNENYAVSI